MFPLKIDVVVRKLDGPSLKTTYHYALGRYVQCCEMWYSRSVNGRIKTSPHASVGIIKIDMPLQRHGTFWWLLQ